MWVGVSVCVCVCGWGGLDNILEPAVFVSVWERRLKLSRVKLLA